MSKIITDLSILKAPNVEVFLEGGLELVKELESSLFSSPIAGVGLAAPQIAINKKVAIVRTRWEKIDLINPIIIEKTNGFINFDEGCLSVPDQRVNTQRYKEIFVKDLLHPEGFVATGDVAIVIQHECDHLESILITDRTIGKKKIGRNDPCPCGKMKNGKPVKWKNCHGR